MAVSTIEVSQAMSPVEALARVSEIDLELVKSKLRDPVEGKGWSKEESELADDEYRKFLALNLMYPTQAIVPCAIVDEIWHAHILDTRAYAQDSNAIFGEFFHHFPYFGTRGEEDARDLEESYSTTLERYRDAFGLAPEDTWLPAGAKKCGRTACKPQRCRSL